MCSTSGKANLHLIERHSRSDRVTLATSFPRPNRGQLGFNSQWMLRQESTLTANQPVEGGKLSLAGIEYLDILNGLDV